MSDLSPILPILSILDVTGKVAILTVPEYDPSYSPAFDESVGRLATELRDGGALSVVVLTEGVTLTALSDEELASCGLQRITDTP